MTTLKERIERRTVVEDRGYKTPCHIWTGAGVKDDGYGRMKVAGKTLLVHKVRWELERGPVPEGRELDHLCRQRACSNPDHLEPVTRAVNLRRGLLGDLKTHCPKGHPLDGERKISYKGQRITRRYCLTCNRDNNRRWREGKTA
jgi:hypothetical protein